MISIKLGQRNWVRISRINANLSSSKGNFNYVNIISDCSEDMSNVVVTVCLPKEIQEVFSTEKKSNQM